MTPILAWFDRQGWKPAAFQVEAWEARLRGESGLVHVPTGSGKTYAATLASMLLQAEQGGTLVYVSPLRAMTRTLAASLGAASEGMGLGLQVETRTSDTAAHVRARQKRRLPDVLLTTPESLSVLLAEPEAPERFRNVRTLVLDEWHELLDSKRGTQCELAAARLRRFSPQMATWALSATLANVDEAAQAAVGRGPARRVTATIDRPFRLHTLLPADVRRLPWSGHLGFALLPELVAWLDPRRSTLLFTNTRAQCELWHATLTAALPDVPIGIHHGSIDAEERARVERGLDDGTIPLVVATASLDLGVDLAPVERVVQIGSPKGIGRMLQRAGRSGHRPGAASEILCVPTHALQLVEIAAVRDAVTLGEVEPRTPLHAPLDVLAQHLVTCALGGGWTRDAMLDEVRSAYSYRTLSDEAFDAAVDLVRQGGRSLRAYPQYHKVVEDGGVHRVLDPEIAKLHRASIGTITEIGTLQVRLGATPLGDIDEGFLAGIEPGASFHFAGRHLELVRISGNVAHVRQGVARRGVTPHWPGHKLPITGSLGAAVRRALDQGSPGAEWDAVGPLLDAQRRMSHVPRANELLVEHYEDEEGDHLFLFPFEGRSVHEGMGALLALRMGRKLPMSVGIAVNDHGFELLSPDPIDWRALWEPAFLATDTLMDDVLASVNATELARRRFRDVARIAGFVNPGPVYRRNTTRQLQASAGLLFDVLVRFDDAHLLLAQARREVLEVHFDEPRLRSALDRLRASALVWRKTEGPTPLSQPLVNDRLEGDRASSLSPRERARRELDRRARFEAAKPRGLPGEGRGRPRRW